MAQQTIGIGSAPNDGLGDTLRVAGAKINDNFTELYASVGSATSRFPAVAVSADTTLTAASHNNHAVEVTTSTSDVTLTLPTTSNTDGDEMIVVKTDNASGRVKFAALAGASNLPWLTDKYDWVKLHYSTNLGWYPVASSLIGNRYRSGAYYPPEGSMSTGSFAANTRIFLTPIYLRKTVTLSGMATLVTAAGDASSYCVLGLYTSKDGKPTDLIAQTAYASSQISTAATGVASGNFVGGNVTVPAGVYWIAVACSYTSSPTFSATSSIRAFTNTIGDTDASVMLQNTALFGYQSNLFAAGSSLPATLSTWTSVTTTIVTGAVKVA